MQRPLRLVLVAALCTLILLYIACGNTHHHHSDEFHHHHDAHHYSDCPSIPGLENVLVVLKTGVTESQTKLPIHRTTTLRCIPNYLVWSDYTEEIAGIPVHDVLANASDTVSHLPEFDLYRRIQTHGRAALTSADNTHDTSTPFGKPNNPGWQLDKWKFLPMVAESLDRYPSADWYVFMEADTYLVWPALLSWLAKLDPEVPYYIGNQMQIRDMLFAHGGSGFVLSRPAVELAASLWRENREYWDTVTAENWAGDCVLGMLLREVGVRLGWAWPLFQLGPVKELNAFDVRYGRTAWCHPILSFHHVSPDEIRELDLVERLWGGDMHRRGPMLYRDVFYELVRPGMEEVLQDWDNLAGEDRRTFTTTIEECKSVCDGEEDCLRWTFTDGICGISAGARLGEKKPGVTAGWMLDRIDAQAETLGRCRKTQWIL